LLDAAKRRDLLRTDFIWKPGWESWHPAASIPELFPVPPAEPKEKPSPIERETQSEMEERIRKKIRGREQTTATGRGTR
jgi:hypothetical protein